MATILKCEDRNFQEDPNKIENFKLFSDVSRKKKGLNPKNLNFDLRLLNPGQYSAPYHSHRFAEELFMIISGSLTLRTPNGLDIVSSGDLVFFEMGDSGAHQFYNHTSEPCTYLDMCKVLKCDYKTDVHQNHPFRKILNHLKKQCLIHLEFLTSMIPR